MESNDFRERETTGSSSGFPSPNGELNNSSITHAPNLSSKKKPWGHYAKKNKEKKEKNWDKKDWDALHQWDSTCNLPQTFGLWETNSAFRKARETEILKHWKETNLYDAIVNRNSQNGKESPSFILHDGPPFANGPIHLGHVFNKILKDVICKCKRMEGFQVHFTPGFDCHGLPIELKVENELQNSASLSPVELIKACRSEAQKWIEIQKEQFQRLGIIADWNHAYQTMDPKYESKVLQHLSTLAKKNYMSRKLKTVPWCIHCKTVLANAEIEFLEASDTSCHVMFPLTEESYRVFELNGLVEASNFEISLLVWTTAPWSLPMNTALVLRPNNSYVLLSLSKKNDKDKEKVILVGAKQVDELCKTLEISKKILAEFNSNVLSELKVKPPVGLQTQKIVPVILSEMVSNSEGTAIVHIAPSCGLKDYTLGVKYGLPIVLYTTEDGKYNDKVEEFDLIGKSIEEGNEILLKKLSTFGSVLYQHVHTHASPSCWRCHHVIYYRATSQWFITLKNEQNNIVDKAKKICENSSNFLPKSSKSSFMNTLTSREDWCVSRQRRWGVPIPDLRCLECGEANLDPQVVDKVSTFVEKEGIEFWSRMKSVKDLLDLQIMSTWTCRSCGNRDVNRFDLGRDTLDCWFVSSLSHQIILPEVKNSKSACDLVIEGRDQHRGWFSSSLVSSTILAGKNFANTILSHGFVCGTKGEKMSKSKDNESNGKITLNEASKDNNMDVLRLWTVITPFDNDMAISIDHLKEIRKEYRKIRNTVRHMIANLYDFEPSRDHIPMSKLNYADQIQLASLGNNYQKIRKAYQSLDFITAWKILSNYSLELRSEYFESLKDRLYFEDANSSSRKSAQNVLYQLLKVWTTLIAPIFSFMADEAYQFLKKKEPDVFKETSVHMSTFTEPPNVWKVISEEKNISPSEYKSSIALKNRQISFTEKLRSAVLKEGAKRSVGKILNATVSIATISNSDSSFIIQSLQSEELNEGFVPFFRELLNVSIFEWKEVENVEELKGNYSEMKEMPGLWMDIKKSEGVACGRCWKSQEVEVKENICHRCKKMLKHHESGN